MLHDFCVLYSILLHQYLHFLLQTIVGLYFFLNMFILTSKPCVLCDGKPEKPPCERFFEYTDTDADTVDHGVYISVFGQNMLLDTNMIKQYCILRFGNFAVEFPYFVGRLFNMLGD